MNVDVRSLQQNKPLDLSKLSKQKRDWLEVFALPRVESGIMPGTCEACVWGRGEHEETCVARADMPAAWTAEDMALFKRLSGWDERCKPDPNEGNPFEQETSAQRSRRVGAMIRARVDEMRA